MLLGRSFLNGEHPKPTRSLRSHPFIQKGSRQGDEGFRLHVLDHPLDREAAYVALTRGYVKKGPGKEVQPEAFLQTDDAGSPPWEDPGPQPHVSGADPSQKTPFGAGSGSLADLIQVGTEVIIGEEKDTPCCRTFVQFHGDHVPGSPFLPGFLQAGGQGRLRARPSPWRTRFRNRALRRIDGANQTFPLQVQEDEVNKLGRVLTLESLGDGHRGPCSVHLFHHLCRETGFQKEATVVPHEKHRLVHPDKVGEPIIQAEKRIPGAHPTRRSRFA
jgi:hypothetical protein